MPHGTQCFVWDLRSVVFYWLVEEVITPVGAYVLQLAVNAEADHWDRVDGPDPSPTAIRLAG